MMKADTVQLVQVFGTDRRHIVPLFQRPYVWERERNWEPLWADVRAATEEIEAERDGGMAEVDRVSRTHFLGAIVLERLPVAPGRIPAFNVIDGQQRLTTLQVLIAACRAAAGGRKATRAESLFGKFLDNPDELVHLDHPYERYKVWPSLSDRDAFREIIPAAVADAAARSGHLLIRARRYFDDELKAWFDNADDVDRRAEALIIAIRERLGLVEIQLEEHDDAQIIFETLNDRGTRLQASDLVKNTLFRLAEQQGADVRQLHERYWQRFETSAWRAEVTTGRIRRARIDLLLSYWLSIRSGSEVPVERLFTDFRIWLRRSHDTTSEVLSDLAHHGQAFQRMENLQSNDATGRLLQTLDLIKTTTPIPLLLHLHVRDGVSSDQRSTAAAAIESFLVRRFTCSLTTKDYNRLFLMVLQGVRSADDSEAGSKVAEVLAAQTAPSRYWPEDSEFFEGLTGGNIYRLLRGPRLRILLGGIETELRKSRSEVPFVPAQAEKLSVEHLLPQQWSQYYPVRTDKPLVDAEEDRRMALHRIGNLTLTNNKLNVSISNGSWPTKRRELGQNTVLLITSASVLQPPPGVAPPLANKWADTWDEDRIILRSLYLADVACRAWPGPRARRSV